jgi:hypothetical protein
MSTNDLQEALLPKHVIARLDEVNENATRIFMGFVDKKQSDRSSFVKGTSIFDGLIKEHVIVVPSVYRVAIGKKLALCKEVLDRIVFRKSWGQQGLKVIETTCVQPIKVAML